MGLDFFFCKDSQPWRGLGSSMPGGFNVRQNVGLDNSFPGKNPTLALGGFYARQAQQVAQ